ncbi:MAG: Ribosomal RNA small subunit methyltransferase H, partial [uncultured bacterium]
SLKQRKILDTVIAVFQTLRIEVNDEMNKLKEGLNLAFDYLKSGGYIGVISFHSIEDRIVKTFFREKTEACKCSKTLPYCICKNESKASEITKKPIVPSMEEINENPRSRSSKLRVVCKL